MVNLQAPSDHGRRDARRVFGQNLGHDFWILLSHPRAFCNRVAESDRTRLIIQRRSRCRLASGGEGWIIMLSRAFGKLGHDVECYRRRCSHLIDSPAWSECIPSEAAEFDNASKNKTDAQPARTAAISSRHQ
jgi:hypothetical protein